MSILDKSEMGIYGLVAANVLSEAVNGKDMFGNELTEEQRQNSLMTALGIAGVAGTGYTFDRLDSRNAVYNANSRVDPVAEEKVINSREDMVTYRRVQGGTPLNASRTRINVDDSGNISIPNKIKYV